MVEPVESVSNQKSEEKPDSEAQTQSSTAVDTGGEQAPSGGPEQKRFPGELSTDFQEVLERIQKKESTGSRLLVFALLPLLGALPLKAKKELEAKVGNPFCFTTAMATGLNIILNLLVYPMLLVLIAVGLNGVEVLFSQHVNNLISLGILLGFVEGVYRLKEGVFQVRSQEEMVFRGSFYGAPLSCLVHWLVAGRVRILRRLPVPVEGFYAKGFVDKLERARRYGHAYTIEDLGEAYHLRLEFPRKVPDIGLSASSDIPSEMPDYDYDLTLKNGHFIIKGRCADEKVRRLIGGVGAFPAEFTTVIPLQDRVNKFSHRCENKLLEILLLKESAGDLEGARPVK